ncbi:hypothetical protein BJ741DRAFT_83787 [Chytriomyces cf. hyalinus JEL632]|nr:hypothetical protein BJ741DRAFT_83787 [Chytriomyces cf. hyalinus JEL632]
MPSSKTSPTTDAQKRGYMAVYVCIRSLATGIVSGGINYGIAFLMYSSPNARPHAFLFPSTIIGDLFITAVVQGVLVWLITSASVYADFRSEIAVPLSATPNLAKRVFIMHQRPQTNPSTLTLINRVLLKWAPLQSETDAFQRSISNEKRRSRFKCTLSLAFQSALWSLLVYVATSVAVIYTWLGMGYYERVTAFWIKAVFGGVCGALSGLVVCSLVVAGAEADALLGLALGLGVDSGVASIETCRDSFETCVV